MTLGFSSIRFLLRFFQVVFAPAKQGRYAKGPGLIPPGKIGARSSHAFSMRADFLLIDERPIVPRSVRLVASEAPGVFPQQFPFALLVSRGVLQQSPLLLPLHSLPR